MASAVSLGYSCEREGQKFARLTCWNRAFNVLLQDKSNSCSSALAVRPFAVSASAKGSCTQSQISVFTSEKYELKCSLSDVRCEVTTSLTVATDKLLVWKNSLSWGNTSVILSCILLLPEVCFLHEGSDFVDDFKNKCVASFDVEVEAIQYVECVSKVCQLDQTLRVSKKLYDVGFFLSHKLQFLCVTQTPAAKIYHERAIPPHSDITVRHVQHPYPSKVVQTNVIAPPLTSQKQKCQYVCFIGSVIPMCAYAVFNDTAYFE